MNHGVTKEELVWVITRVIGAVFLWLAVVKLGVLLGMFFTTRNSGMHIPAGMLGRVVWPAFLALAVYGFLAFYFLRRGAFFVGLISRMNHLNEDASDTDEFKEWLEEDAANGAYPHNVQMAAFEKWKMGRY